MIIICLDLMRIRTICCCTAQIVTFGIIVEIFIHIYAWNEPKTTFRDHFVIFFLLWNKIYNWNLSGEKQMNVKENTEIWLEKFHLESRDATRRETQRENEKEPDWNWARWRAQTSFRFVTYLSDETTNENSRTQSS